MLTWMKATIRVLEKLEKFRRRKKDVRFNQIRQFKHTLASVKSVWLQQKQIVPLPPPSAGLLIAAINLTVFNCTHELRWFDRYGRLKTKATSLQRLTPRNKRAAGITWAVTTRRIHQMVLHQHNSGHTCNKKINTNKLGKKCSWLDC